MHCKTIRFETIQSHDFFSGALVQRKVGRIQNCIPKGDAVHDVGVNMQHERNATATTCTHPPAVTKMKREESEFSDPMLRRVWRPDPAPSPVVN